MNIEEAKNVAINAYKTLRPYRENIYAVEDILLWNNKKDAVIVFSGLNLAFLLIAQLELPVYSILPIIVFFLFIVRDKLFSFAEFVTSFLRYRDSYADTDNLITIEHFCVYIGVFTYVWRDCVQFIRTSFLDYNLINVALLTFLVFSLFIVCYYLGDTLCNWFILHFILFIPLILYYRIGFRVMHYPWKAEREIYRSLLTYSESH